jgi:hypothetical protein
MSSVASTNVSLLSAFSNDEKTFSIVNQKLQKGAFSLNSRISAPMFLSTFIFVLNFIQTTFIGFNRLIDYGENTKVVSKYFSFVTRQWIFTETSYTTFLVVLILSFVFVLFTIVIFVWVIQKDDFKWEFVLNFTSNLIFVTTHALFVPFLSIFATAFECNGKTGKLVNFEQMECVVFPNDLAMAISTFGCFFLLTLSFWSQF